MKKKEKKNILSFVFFRVLLPGFLILTGWSALMNGKLDNNILLMCFGVVFAVVGVILALEF